MFGLPAWLVIVVLVAAWILFFVWIMLLASRLGGWRTLAEKYPVDHVIDGKTWRWQAARLRRLTSYNGILIVTVNQQGVMFRMPFLFRPGHRPFFVPWAELTAVRTNSWLGKGVTLSTQRAPDAPLHISNRLADRLKQEAGDAWRELK